MVAIFLAHGFEEIEALCVVDILRRADIDICTVSVTEDLRVTGAHDITVRCDKTIAQIDTCDVLILPGGMPGTTNLMQCKKLQTLCLDTAKNGLVAAICAAPMLLGGLGLLQGKKAVCFPGFEDKLTGAILQDASVVCDGNIITAKGPGVAGEFAFALVAALKDEQIAQSLKKVMQYE